MSFTTLNPATESALTSYTYISIDDATRAVERSYATFELWKQSDVAERQRCLTKLNQVLLEKKAELASLATEEMGKPLSQSQSEVEKCASLAKFIADNLEAIIRYDAIRTEAQKSYVRFDPLGPIFGVMPWNFPYWQVFRFALPAIAVGNTAILKHASNVSGCSQKIEELFKAAGFPSFVFQSLILKVQDALKLIEHPHVRGVSLTGSAKAGRDVAAQAGRFLKKTVLELGGSDPYLVLRDANIQEAAEICAQSRLINSGQSCISAKRFLVDHKIFADFESALIEILKSKKIGAPGEPETDLGPLARADLRDEVHSQVIRTVTQGARLKLGGYLPTEKGFFYPPTVLSGVRPTMTSFQEEVFGPVASLTPFETEDEAIRLANDSSYGLGSAIFSRDTARAEMLAARIEAGNCFINDFVRSDPRLPFGGIKDSGFGRELSRHGMLEFTNFKTVYIK